jgi:Arc/MetJ-type ribon-helix-helix transcriptional regulator
VVTGVKVSVRLPPKLAEEIESLVKAGLFSNRSDLIKEAIRHYLRELRKELTDEEKWRLKAVEDILKEDWESEEDSFWDSY